MQPFVKLSIQETLFWKLLGFPKNFILIPLLQPRNFMFLAHERIHKHLKFFNEHLRLQVVVIMGLNFLQKFGPKTQITNREMFVEYRIELLSHMFHCLLYQFLHLCRRSITFLGNIFTIELDCHICNGCKLPLQAKHEVFNRIMTRSKVV